MHNIILDTDPGIDDAMAIAYAIAHPDINLLGLTTVFGNVSVDEAAENALRLLNEFNFDCPVTRGQEKPLEIEPNTPSYHVHGDNGLGNIDLKKSNKKLDPRSATQFMIDLTKKMPGEISICAVGPLTNLAHVLKTDPDITKRVKQVVIMGGALQKRGNVTPVAEANIWNDPHAAEAVFAADWPVVIAPLDVTQKVICTPSYLASLERQSPKMGGLIANLARYYMQFYQNATGINGCIPHDVMALAYLTIPGIYMQKSVSIAVSTEGPSIGQTVFQPTGISCAEPMWDTRPNHMALLDIDEKALLSNFMMTLTRMP